MYPRWESNPHAHSALRPQRSPSTNSSTWVCNELMQSYQSIAKKKPSFEGFLVIRLGFEPRTPSLKGMCSTS